MYFLEFGKLKQDARHSHVTVVMKFLLSTPTAIGGFARQAGCRRAWKGTDQARRWAGTYEAYAEALMRRPTSKTSAGGGQPARNASRTNSAGEYEEPATARTLSFPALGLDLPFVKALQKAFPNVQQPTDIQAQLIPEILAGKDVLLRDATGSGK